MPATPARRAPSTKSKPVQGLVDQLFQDVEPARESGRLPSALLARRKARAQERIEDALEARGEKSISKSLHKDLETLIRGWVERDFDPGFPDAEAFELRCFQEGELRAAKTSGDKAQLFAALETRHRAEVLKEYGKIELRGLQMSARVYQDLEVVYVRLRVQDDSSKGEVIKAAEGIEIVSIPRLSIPEMLARHERSVLVGAPGSGKSTIVSYLAARAAAGRLHEEVEGWKQSPVPFVLAVRSLKEPRIDVDAIAKAQPEADADFVRQVFKKKRALLLVDGLDEAQAGAEALIPSLRAFVKAYPGNGILVTTRPSGNVGGERIEIPGFATTTLQAMDRDEVYVFIERWCLGAELSIQKDRKRAEDDAKRAAEDLKARVRASRPVEQIAQTPLMCSVLCIVHRFLGQRIPERRAALYEACTNVLLYEWDRAKFPTGSTIGELDAHDKKFLLSGLARWMHERREAEVSREDLIQRFAERLPSIKRSAVEAELIVREIQDRSGLLVEKRPGFYAFSHLTFQEYLTAVEYVRVGAIKELAAKHEDRWWHEVIPLAAGLPGADAPGLIRALLDADRKRQKASTAMLLAAHCVETSIDVTASLRREAEDRLATLVPPRSNDDAEKLIELGEVAGPILLRALSHATPYERGLTAIVLGRIKYEPATPALVGLLLDESQIKRVDVVHISNIQLAWGDPSVAGLSAIALFNLAVESDVARMAFERSLPNIDGGAINILYWFAQPSEFTNFAPATSQYLAKIAPRLKDLRESKRSPMPAAHSD